MVILQRANISGAEKKYVKFRSLKYNNVARCQRILLLNTNFVYTCILQYVHPLHCTREQNMYIGKMVIKSNMNTE